MRGIAKFATLALLIAVSPASAQFRVGNSTATSSGGRYVLYSPNPNVAYFSPDSGGGWVPYNALRNYTTSNPYFGAFGGTLSDSQRRLLLDPSSYIGSSGFIPATGTPFGTSSGGTSSGTFRRLVFR